MKAKIALASVLMAGLIVSCGGQVMSPASKGATASSTTVTPAEPSTVPSTVTQDVLLKKAEELAKSELARLAAAEMIYRNKVYDHIYFDEDNGVRTDVLMKYYRNFHDMEVLDVKRTDSLLYPVEFEIRYDFDMLGTKEVAGPPNTLTELAKSVKNDNAFQLYISDSLVRTYRCGETGECAVMNPDSLPRPNYWELNAWVKSHGVLQVEDMTQITGS